MLSGSVLEVVVLFSFIFLLSVFQYFFSSINVPISFSSLSDG